VSPPVTSTQRLDRLSVNQEALQNAIQQNSTAIAELRAATQQNTIAIASLGHQLGESVSDLIGTIDGSNCPHAVDHKLFPKGRSPTN
jgi:hypothetical protein